MRRTLLAGLVGAAGGGGVVLMGLSGDLFGQAAPAPSVIAAAAEQVAVIDGDTLRVAGQVVRLSGVLAPERGQACAAGPDCGGRASAALAGLVLDRRVECRIAGHDAQGRPAAYCLADGVDINATMVSIGWVHAEADGLRAAEAAARGARRGLWTAG